MKSVNARGFEVMLPKIRIRDLRGPKFELLRNLNIAVNLVEVVVGD